MDINNTTAFILLVKPEYRPAPQGVEIVQDYGAEIVIAEDKQQHRGDVCYITGDKEAIANWLRPHNDAGLWVCNNPMSGNWHTVSIKTPAAIAAS